MINKRENAFVEAMKFIKDRNNKLAEKDEQNINERVESHSKFLNEYYNVMKNRENNRIQREKIVEGARNAELATAIKAIYITALEAATLTDNGILLAEELVDKWIQDEGGATKIMRECKNKTYLLSRICDIVEEAALEDIKVIFEDDKDDDDITKEEEDLDYDLDDDDDKKDKEEVIDDPETEEEVEVDDEDEKEVDYDIKDKKDEADQLDDEKEADVKDEVEVKMDDTIKDFDDNDEDEDDDDDEDDDEDEDLEDEDIDDDGEDDIEPEPENYDNKVLEDLDKEEDVQRAVALIRQRVADAEETFIKNNAKDKEQINALLGKISDNIKTIEDMKDSDKEKGKDAVAQESVKMSRRKINDITNNRPLSIMEMFARNLNKDIIRDESLKENYIEEDGSLDIDTIVESAKVLYGFLETLNTIQLKKIDENYIKSIFE